MPKWYIKGDRATSLTCFITSCTFHNVEDVRYTHNLIHFVRSGKVYLMKH